MRRSIIPRICNMVILLLILLIAADVKIIAQAGSAPMTTLPNFPGPLAIDGYLQRQGTAGDWLSGPGGMGNVIFTNTGEKLVPLCFLYRDKYNTADDEVFSKGYFQDDPNTMKWGLRRATSKTDLNNILIFLALNPADNHIWVAMAADRRTTGKNSTIDFEFLQKQVLMTGDINTGHDKGFFSAGTDGGRTIGDLIVSVKFQNSGGSFSSVEYFQWQPEGVGGSYRYFQVTPPNGTAFTATNAVPVDVPFGAFGSNTYAPFTFIETAVDFTVLVSGGSFWVKSKSNDNFDDFYPPIGGNSGFGGMTVSYFFYDLYTAQLNATYSLDPAAVNYHWTAVGATNGAFVDPSVTGSLNNYDIPDPIFTADTNYDCISYIYKVTASPAGNPTSIVAETYVVINSPCKIGKPINPDQMHQGETLNEESNIDNNELEVYPNPAKRTSSITLKSANGIKDIQITDLSGRVVQQLTGTATNYLELKNLPAGVYLLKVYSRSSGKTAIKKLLVTN